MKYYSYFHFWLKGQSYHYKYNNIIILFDLDLRIYFGGTSDHIEHNHGKSAYGELFVIFNLSSQSYKWTPL